MKTPTSMILKGNITMFINCFVRREQTLADTLLHRKVTELLIERNEGRCETTSDEYHRERHLWWTSSIWNNTI